MLLQLTVQSAHVIFAVESESYSALVADDDDGAPRGVERGNGGLGAREQVEIAPLGDIFALGWLAIYDTIAIEKDILDTGKSAMTLSRFVIGGHCMITRNHLLLE